jgi:hypothetical protein
LKVQTVLLLDNQREKPRPAAATTCDGSHYTHDMMMAIAAPNGVTVLWFVLILFQCCWGCFSQRPPQPTDGVAASNRMEHPNTATTSLCIEPS